MDGTAASDVFNADRDARLSEFKTPGNPEKSRLAPCLRPNAVGRRWRSQVWVWPTARWLEVVCCLYPLWHPKGRWIFFFTVSGGLCSHHQGDDAISVSIIPAIQDTVCCWALLRCMSLLWNTAVNTAPSEAQIVGLKVTHCGVKGHSLCRPAAQKRREIRRSLASRNCAAGVAG